jgi:hypothetical protein
MTANGLSGARAVGVRLVTVLGAMSLALLLPWRAVGAQSGCVTNWTNNSSCRVDIVISSTIQATRRLVVTPGTSFAMAPTSGQLSVDDYVAGMFDASGSIQVTVQSNAPWRVRMQSLSGSMSGSCSNKSASTILWGTTSTARTTPVSTTAATIFSGTAPTAGQSRDIFLRVGIGWLTDAPVTDANCTLPVSFSVGAP